MKNSFALLFSALLLVLLGDAAKAEPRDVWGDPFHGGPFPQRGGHPPAALADAMELIRDTGRAPSGHPSEVGADARVIGRDPSQGTNGYFPDIKADAREISYDPDQGTKGYIPEGAE